MKPQFDICIRGAGMVGKVLALLLARERLRVALVRSPDDKRSEGALVDIRSYALNAASRQLLQSLKVWPASDADACPIAHMRVHEAQGAHIAFDAGADASLRGRGPPVQIEGSGDGRAGNVGVEHAHLLAQLGHGRRQ